MSEMASYNFALVKLALGHVDGAIEAANVRIDLRYHEDLSYVGACRWV